MAASAIAVAVRAILLEAMLQEARRARDARCAYCAMGTPLNLAGMHTPYYGPSTAVSPIGCMAGPEMQRVAAIEAELAGLGK